MRRLLSMTEAGTENARDDAILADVVEAEQLLIGRVGVLYQEVWRRP